MHIQLATSDEHINACYPTIAQLRPHIAQSGFLSRVRSQFKSGYQLAFGQTSQSVVTVAGFRIHQNLAYGQHLYVDDLVTHAEHRSHAYGKQLLDWLIDHARQNNCLELHLDSGVQRFDAHRFYLNNKMHISSHHFAIRITPQD